ncbi:hypothetical protein DIPPA_03500 [Diplonema papillatum]|nr:hypothetical protein DIPPA_02195 [Diplonema papillatum]KAJ9442497.1 hypothetical protein DIPPA_04386 [Diplonema papillatum]KAJ9445909.1 hypothetical protein DIPPA_28634 [Diplonema papillatum]KAJ9450403.1 hypothetical protein DIPPA_03500 [Diplonema papillatum]
MADACNNLPAKDSRAAAVIDPDDTSERAASIRQRNFSDKPTVFVSCCQPTPMNS